MSKRHKHADLIVAWSEGAQIQEKCYPKELTDVDVWINQASPRWIPEHEYRIKPREFEEGEWYPIKIESTIPDSHISLCAKYLGGVFRTAPHSAVSFVLEPEDAVWVGEKLDIDWGEESKPITLNNGASWVNPDTGKSAVYCNGKWYSHEPDEPKTVWACERCHVIFDTSNSEVKPQFEEEVYYCPFCENDTVVKVEGE